MNNIRNNLAAILNFAFIILCVMLMKNSMLSFATFVMVFMYKVHIINLSNNINKIKSILMLCELQTESIFKVIEDTPKEIFVTLNANIKDGKIEFKNVEFYYNKDQPILNGVSLSVLPNKLTAIVAKIGGGKTTILSLIKRLYDPINGETYLDDYNIKDLSEKYLRDSIGVVNQTAYIFNQTLRQNLLFVKPDATDEELYSALKQAEMFDYIMSLKDGLDTLLGENGIVLSGGQRQRIAIARILLKKSKVLIFDESTSSFYNESQNKILKVINSLKKDKTIIVVAHMLSTIVDADNIILLDNGKVKAQGTHKELIKNSSIYKNLYNNEEFLKDN